MINLDVSLKAIKYFTYYISNKWSLEEAIHLFGEMLGYHIYDKFYNNPNVLDWFANLDNNCQETILNRVLEIYDT